MTARGLNVDIVAWLYQVYPGGVERIAHELANHRYKWGNGRTTLRYARPFWWRPAVPFADYAGYPLRATLLPVHPYMCNGKYKECYIEPLFLRLLRRQYRRLGATERPHVVHGLGCNALPGAHAGIPSLTTLIGLPRFWYERETLKLVARIVCPAKKLADLLVQRGVPANKLVVMHQGVNCERFGTSDPQAALHAYALPRDRRYIVALHNFHPKKRTIDIIDALALLHERGDLPRDMDLVLAGHGPGPLVDTLRAAIVQRGLADRVHLRVSFEGPHLPALYRLGHIYIAAGSTFPDDTQIPMTLFEAMAAGAPIVTANVGAVAEVIRHGENGLLVEPASASALAEALRLLLADDALRWALATQAQADAARYAWPEIVGQYEILYREIA